MSWIQQRLFVQETNSGVLFHIIGHVNRLENYRIADSEWTFVCQKSEIGKSNKPIKIIFHHNNATFHSATGQNIEFAHPPHTPKLAPNDFCLFPTVISCKYLNRNGPSATKIVLIICKIGEYFKKQHFI